MDHSASGTCVIAVCDDEEVMTRKVAQWIREWNPAAEVHCFSSGEELLEHYRDYQAVFLDIDMGGINGIETGRRIRKIDKKTKIVYLTAYRDYAAGAFGVHAFQYLLKPVSKKAVHHVLEEIFSYMEQMKPSPILDFQTAGGLVCIPADEIYFFEYESRRIRMVTAEEEYLMSGRIGSVAGRMESFGFSVPHQSFVVNMLHVKNVKDQRIVLDNGMEIPLSQKKQKTWKQELTAYLSSRLENRR